MTLGRSEGVVRQRSIAVLMLTMLLAVGGRGSAAPGRAAASAAKSPAKTAAKAAAVAALQFTPTLTQIYGAYWQVSPGYSTTLILRNKDAQNPATVNVILYSQDGLVVSGTSGPAGITAQIQLPANRTQQVALANLIPADGATRIGGLALQFDSTAPGVSGQAVITKKSNGTTVSVPLNSGYALDTENALYASWWLTDAGEDGDIVLFNSSSQAIVVTPAITVQGVDQPAGSITVAPNASQTVSLRSILAQVNQSTATMGSLTLSYSGPAHAVQPALMLANSTTGFWIASAFHARHNQNATTSSAASIGSSLTSATSSGPNSIGSSPSTAATSSQPPVRWQVADLKLNWSGTTNPLHGYALLSNGTTSAMDVGLEAHFINSSNLKNPVQRVRLPVTILGPLETKAVDLSQFVTNGTITGNPTRLGLVASHPGAPGDLAVTMFSVNPDSSLAFSAPGSMLSPATVDVSYFQVAKGKASPKTVRNPFSTAMQGQVILYYPTANGTGSYHFPVMQLAANSSQKLNLGQISRVPDVRGFMAPKGTTFGVAVLLGVAAGSTTAAAAPQELCEISCASSSSPAAASNASPAATSTVGPVANATTTVTTPGGCTTTIIGIFVQTKCIYFNTNFNQNCNPPEISISPDSGGAGDSVSVTISGSFLPQDFTIDAGDEIIVDNAVWVDENTITADFEMPDDPLSSSWQVTVSGPDGTSNAVSFSLSLPTITGTNLDLGGIDAGKSKSVIITGTSFPLTPTVDAGPEITVTNVVVNSNHKITADFDIPLDATGQQHVTVTNAAGTSNAWPFTVNPARPPVLEPIVPGSGVAGATVDLSIGGGTFRDGDQVIVGGGITVSNVKVVDQNTITATFQLPLCGPFGVQQVSVNDPQVGPSTNSEPFTVNAPPPPQITDVSPDPWQAGFSDVPVTIQGTGFGCSPSLQISDPNSAISSTPAIVVSTDPTTGEALSIQTNVTIDPADGPESATVEVFNNDDSTPLGAVITATRTRTGTASRTATSTTTRTPTGTASRTATSTVTRTPTGTATALLESPPFTVPVKAVPPKPLILFAQPDASGSGATACSNSPQDISGSKKNVVAGQQIALIACINKLAQGFTIVSESWTAPSGFAVAGFSVQGTTNRPDATGGHMQAIQPVNCGTATSCVLPVFYWVCPTTGSGACQYPGDAQVTFQYQVSDGTTQQTLSTTATFTVSGPTNVNVATKMKPVIIHILNIPHPHLTMQLGNFTGVQGSVNGIDFPATGNAFPNGSGTKATYQWIQIITGLQGTFLLQPGKQIWTLANTSRFIDTDYPYDSEASTADSPDIPLPQNVVLPESETAESFHARMWLMWDPALKFPSVSGCNPAQPGNQTANPPTPATPSQCDSIPIPIGFVDWNWSGDAINTLDTVTAPTDTQGWRAGAPDGMPGCGNPNQALGDTANGQPPGPAFSHQAFGFPEWDTFIRGTEAFTKPKMTCTGASCPP